VRIVSVQNEMNAVFLAQNKKTKFKQDREEDRHKATEIVLTPPGVAVPVCPHGPTVLFRRGGEAFFACSAYRDRKDCAFYVAKNEDSAASVRKWSARARDWLEGREEVIQRNREATLEAEPMRAQYCHTCDLLLSGAGLPHPPEHDLSAVLPGARPTDVLRQKAGSKREAQFHFSEVSLKVIVSTVAASGSHHVLCLGAPTVYHSLTRSGLHALLLDIDWRLSAFYSDEDWCWYNMFNHHFFLGTKSKNVYLEFLKAARKDLVIVLDPPFGGRTELLGHCLTRIAGDWREQSGQKAPRVIWIFPYFSEGKIKRACPEVQMSDFQVEYDNHGEFSAAGRSKKGSPVRIFTDLPLAAIDLSVVGGGKYRKCSDCNGIWTLATAQHCRFCGRCVARDGGRYKHCRECGHCVKESWRHCRKCGRCALPGKCCQENKL